MKKTMTKEELYAIMKTCEEYDDDAGFSILNGYRIIDALSEAGISWLIYHDTDGHIIKPGDECEFGGLTTWKAPFLGEHGGLYFGATNYHHNFSTTCRKLPAEVWEPVPVEDISLKGGNFNEVTNYLNGVEIIANPLKWAKTRVTNGKLEGVRKDGVTKKELDELKKAVTGE